jgi:mitochondrial fission process protein 1
MFWGKGSDDKKPEDKTPEVKPPGATADPRKDATAFDPNKLPERRKLPRNLQNIVEKSDKEENFFDELVDG